MIKLTVIINGRGGVGKDTLIDALANHYSVLNVSAITEIKEAAKLLGWTGDKSRKSRKFLSDLKKLSIEYNNLPTMELMHEYYHFLRTDTKHDVLFVHIREPGEIVKFMDRASGSKVVTLLIKRQSDSLAYGNDSDDFVENYGYDYIYNNDLPLSEAKADFLKFFSRIVKENTQ